MHIIFGLFGGDAPWQVLDTETGTLTSHGGGYRVGAEEFKHAVQSLKHAADVKDPEFRRAVVKAASDYFQTKTEILSPAGNVIAIF